MENNTANRIEILKTYLKEDPEDCFSMYALALELAKLKSRDEAIALLQQLLQHDPGYLAAYYQLGKLLEEQGNSEKAASVFEKGMDVAQVQRNQKTMSELQSARDTLRD